MAPIYQQFSLSITLLLKQPGDFAFEDFYITYV